ncbi:MAG: OB-fold nucleic acid binding domain-containing protein [Candidatus Thermoplasmatota archaeon]|nr:OB-fold nucleic acid binding domain-containing protein [Candidatus Thermoplasmatota archaeon]
MGKDFWIGDVRAGAHDGSEVELKGWVHRARGSKKIWFLVLRDSTGTVQCVIKRESVGEDCFRSISGAIIESSVIIK